MIKKMSERPKSDAAHTVKPRSRASGETTGVTMVFGNIDGSTPLRALDLFSALMDKHVWYSSRTLRQVPQNAVLLFYAKKIGFCGVARVIGQAPVEPDDGIPRSLGLYGFRTKFLLAGIEQFTKPVPVQPLLPRLHFIGNKNAWNVYFRASGVHIPASDLAEILSVARLDVR